MYELQVKDELIFVRTDEKDIINLLRVFPKIKRYEGYYTLEANRINFLCVESLGVPTKAYDKYREARALSMKPQQFLIDAFEKVRPQYQPGKEFLAHQRDACVLSLLTTGFVNTSERGCGKTATGWAMINIFDSKKVCIVVNKPGIPEWVGQQFDIFAPTGNDPITFPLDENESIDVKIAKIKYLSERKDIRSVILINYEILEKIKEAIFIYKPEFIIFDESWKIKNPKAKSTKAAIEISDYAKRTLLLNGSPVSRHVGDYWSHFRIACGPNMESDSEWINKYAKAVKVIGPYGAQTKYVGCKDPVGLITRIAPFFYRATKETCLTLPKKRRYPVIMPMLKEQTKWYDSVEAEGVTFLNELSVDSAAVLQLRLRQIANGFAVTDEGVKFFPSAKLEWILETLQSRVEEDGILRCIIWCFFNQEVLSIVPALLKKGIKAIGITGSGIHEKNNAEITQIKNNFNNRESTDRYQVLVCQIEKMCSSHNLQSADIHIIHGQTFKKISREQMEDRSHRIGRTEDVEYYELICSEVDSEIYKSLKEKDDTANRVTPSTVDTVRMDIDRKEVHKVINV